MNIKIPKGGRHRNRFGFTGRVDACRKSGYVRGTKFRKGKHDGTGGNSRENGSKVSSD